MTVSTGSEKSAVGTSNVGVEISVVGEAMAGASTALQTAAAANVSPITVNPSRSKAACEFSD